MELATYLKHHFRADFSDPDQLLIILSNQAFKKDAIITAYGQIEREYISLIAGLFS